ncbi:hypothetical protein [Reyranella soli]|jgi:hypothetical protein|uniref:Uncharacterized protein n=1 Tax=Reyranella soli TaxID=1230389 RepID=A0A512NG95_9HYPH|nr:hypothetical protein [Reyranella soli]GEP57968.1 hypothetical protein RSO01_51340 [Reyranella soli]
MSRSEQTPLSTNEEITLRRVAYGQSDVAHLRAEDLERLRALALVAGSPRTPTLTAAGKARFDRLAKPAAVTQVNAQNELMATLGRLMARAGRR